MLVRWASSATASVTGAAGRATGSGAVIGGTASAEVSSICDRIGVMRDGELIDIVPRDEATPERLLGLALPA